MKVIAIDTETVSLSDKTMLAFSWSDGKTTGVIPIKMNTTANCPKDQAMLILQGRLLRYKVVFHNASFDIPVLLKYGIPMEWFKDIEDTVIIANLVDENMQHGLKPLVKKFFKHEMATYKEVCGTGKKQITFADVPWDKAEKYAREDAYYTIKLYNLLIEKLKKDKKVYALYQNIEKPLLPIIADMHYKGITIDTAHMKKLTKQCSDKVNLSLAKLTLLIGEKKFESMNLNSPKQLREYFVEDCKLPIIKRSKATNMPSVDKEVLKIYAETNAEAKALLEYRKYAKIEGTFIPALTPINGDKIYASFNQAGTVSGRFSSSRPNMQNIPREDDLHIRKAIIADEGQILIGADYSQIELRVLAHFSKDLNLVDAYSKNKDIHQKTADACGISRQDAKIVNFGLVYGMGAKTLAKQIEKSVEEAQQYIERYFNTYTGVKEFWSAEEKNIVDNGFVETITGRKRRRSKFFFQKDSYDKGAEIRSMINSIIQGTAADLMKTAMVSIHSRLKEFDARIISTVHDEVLISCPLKYAQCCYDIIKSSMMETGKYLNVPIDVDVKFGRSWEEAHGDGIALKELK